MRWLVVMVLGLASACYSPSYQDCLVSCPAEVCPAGLECLAGVCRAPGMTGPCANPMVDARSDGSTGDIPIEMLADAQLTALCEYAVRCGMWEDVPVCKQVYINFSRSIREVAEAVVAGTVLYNPAKAQECLDGFATRSCDRTDRFGTRPAPPACFEGLVGTLDAGATCILSEECKSQECVKTTCTMACCTGQCVGSTPPGARAINQQCTGRDYCVGGYCDAFSNMCLAYKTQGMACQGDYQCADNLGCRTVTGNMQCEPLVGVNGPCMTTADCAQLSNVCRAGACMAGGLTGFQCASTSECQGDHPCDTTLTCALPPTIGESCVDAKVCLTGYCIGSAAEPDCMAKLPDNSTCDPARSGIECEGGFCDMTQLRCVTPDCF